MHSLYSIDGGHPTVFIPSPEVDEDAYGQKFFDSGTLPLDRHTLKITNTGDQLWLDYFLYDDGNDEVASTTGTKTATMTVTQSRHPSSSSTVLINPSLPSSSSEVSTGGIIPSTSAEITTLSQPNPALPIATPPTSSLVSPFSLTPQQSSLLPPPSTLTLSLNATVPSQAAVNTPGEQHARGVSRTALIALAAASGTIAAIALLAILLRLRRWYWNSPRRPRGWFGLSFRNTLCKYSATVSRIVCCITYCPFSPSQHTQAVVVARRSEHQSMSPSTSRRPPPYPVSRTPRRCPPELQKAVARARAAGGSAAVRDGLLTAACASRAGRRGCRVRMRLRSRTPRARRALFRHRTRTLITILTMLLN